VEKKPDPGPCPSSSASVTRGCHPSPENSQKESGAGARTRTEDLLITNKLRLKGPVSRRVRAVASCPSDPIAPSVRPPSRQQHDPESAR
jgi:hypothetical protein